MLGLNTQGLIVGGIFLLFGLFDTWVIRRVVYDRIWNVYQDRQQSGETSVHPDTIMNLVLVVNVLVLPLIGYAVGPALAAATGFRPAL